MFIYMKRRSRHATVLSSRIPAGIETPAADEDKDISAIKELAATLTLRSRRELIRYAQYLKSGEDHGTLPEVAGGFSGTQVGT
jgi:hypothetical protein